MARRRVGKVFISFKSEEVDNAEALHRALTELGFECWWMRDLQCGGIWAEELDAAVRQAACIVVLWSTRSLASRWVRHEASQAIARQVYAPIRIERVEIETPYDRVQVADLSTWDGKLVHDGFKHLRTRLEQLVPLEKSLVERSLALIRRNLTALLASAVAALTLGALATLVTRNTQLFKSLEGLVAEQRRIASDVERAVHPIENVRASLYITVDDDAPGLAAYRNRIEATLSRDAGLPGGAYVSIGGVDGGIEQIAIPYLSELWPRDDESEGVALFALTVVDANLAFALSPDARLWDADYRLRLSTEGRPDREASVTWRPRERQLGVSLHRLSIEAPEGNGRVVSVPDLLRSTLRFELANTMQSRNAPADLLLGARRHVRLSTLFLDVSERRFTIRREAFHSYVGQLPPSGDSKVPK